MPHQVGSANTPAPVVGPLAHGADHAPAAPATLKARAGCSPFARFKEALVSGFRKLGRLGASLRSVQSTAKGAPTPKPLAERRVMQLPPEAPTTPEAPAPERPGGPAAATPVLAQVGEPGPATPPHETGETPEERFVDVPLDD
jgi:hypothetical protein